MGVAWQSQKWKLLNSSNNCLNAKLKQVIKLPSSLKDFITSLFTIIQSLRLECDHSSVNSAACSKACYEKDLTKSVAESTTCSKACYHKDSEKSHADSAACSKTCYDRDLNKSRVHTQKPVMIGILIRVMLILLYTQSLVMNRTLRQAAHIKDKGMYIFCLFTFENLCYLRYSLKPPTSSMINSYVDNVLAANFK